MNLNKTNVNYLNVIRAFVDKHYLGASKWIGTAATIIGALATASGHDPVNVIAFGIGCMFWLLASIRMKDAVLMAVNAGLLGIYALAIIVRFI